MGYPGLATSLKNQLTESEWTLVEKNIKAVDNLAWHQNDQACRLLEAAAEEAIENKCFRCAARILHYYDVFFAA